MLGKFVKDKQALKDGFISKLYENLAEMIVSIIFLKPSQRIDIRTYALVIMISFSAER